MLLYGGLSLSEIETTGNGWTRNVEFNRDTVAIVSGVGKNFYVSIRWKKYSMTSDVLSRIATLVSHLERYTGEVINYPMKEW